MLREVRQAVLEPRDLRQCGALGAAVDLGVGAQFQLGVDGTGAELELLC